MTQATSPPAPARSESGTDEPGVVPPARFRAVRADAADAPRLGVFWAAVLDQPLVVDRTDGSARLDPGPDRSGSATVWFDPVPEPQPEPRLGSRVRLAVRLVDADPAPLVALGAVVVADPVPDAPWWVLADPEGNPFRAVGPHPDVVGVTRVTPFELVVDSRDPRAQAHWWADAVGGAVGHDVDRGVAWISGAVGFPYAYWVFVAVPTPATVGNRWHWDVEVTGTGPGPLLAHGATLVTRHGADTARRDTARRNSARRNSGHAAADRWVLADPEGNQFGVEPGTADGSGQAGAAPGVGSGLSA